MATLSEAIKLLLQENEEVDKARRTELDRLILRLFSSPALLTHLKDAKFVDDDTAEVEFELLPLEQVPVVQAIIGPIQVETFSYTKNSEPHSGFRFKTSALVEYYKEIAANMAV